jgi:2-Cys peroxiredoxin 5
MLSRRIVQTAPTLCRGFRSTAGVALQVGDRVPSVELPKDAPSNLINLHNQTLKGKYIIVGVPGAFSPGCSGSHVPGYWKNHSKFADKGVNGIFVVAVNDCFVTGAWEKSFEASISENPGIQFVADHGAEFSKEWDVVFDAAKFFGGDRSKRYAAVINDGEVVQAFVEPDATGINVSSAEAVLKSL